MGKMQRTKGVVGEREWSQWLRSRGFTEARRGAQRKGGPDSPDVVNGIPNTHVEVKRTERLRLSEAIDQAAAEAPEHAVPYVAHRPNYRNWVIIIRADDLHAFARAVCDAFDNRTGETDGTQKQ